MENQLRHDKDDSCECPCHPESGVAGCPGCAHKHGGFKMGSMDPFEMVMPMWYKASFAAYSQLMIEKLKKRIEAAHGPVMASNYSCVFQSTVLLSVICSVVLPYLRRCNILGIYNVAALGIHRMYSHQIYHTVERAVYDLG
jgi:hypothetical protein